MDLDQPDLAGEGFVGGGARLRHRFDAIGFFCEEPEVGIADPGKAVVAPSWGPSYS